MADGAGLIALGNLEGVTHHVHTVAGGWTGALESYALAYRRTRDPQARADYEALLGDLEANYAEGTTRLLEGGREAMDLEITVLRDRLQRDGVTIER